jgi:hypothetical protein
MQATAANIAQNTTPCLQYHTVIKRQFETRLLASDFMQLENVHREKKHAHNHKNNAPF